MKINFAMWGQALSGLVKMDSKQEWESLDVISKWLIATRSGVTTVTIYSCIIAGLLSWRYLASVGQPFPFWVWLVVTLGLFIAHGTNNILNDYTDYVKGVDTDNYFRLQYGVHPLAQGFWDKKTQLRWFYVSGVIAFASGIFALAYRGVTPVMLALFGFGIITLLFYTWPLKHIGLGEFIIFLIWGPVFVGGVFYVLTGVWDWTVALAGVPFGLSVASINVGKHTDKLLADSRKEVRTLPVIIGEKAARYVTMVAILLAYLVFIYLVFFPRYFTPILLIILFAIPRAKLAFQTLLKPRPETPPAGFEYWPTWFSAVAFYHNRMFGGLMVLGLIIDTLLHVFAPNLIATYWPML